MVHVRTVGFRQAQDAGGHESVPVATPLGWPDVAEDVDLGLLACHQKSRRSSSVLLRVRTRWVASRAASACSDGSFLQQRQQADAGRNGFQVPQDLSLGAAEVPLLEQDGGGAREPGPRGGVGLPNPAGHAQTRQLLTKLAGLVQALLGHLGVFVALHVCNLSLKGFGDRDCRHSSRPTARAASVQTQSQSRL